MVLERYRAGAQPYIARLARPLLSWPPARVSALAFALSGLAGLVAALARWFGPLLFLPVGLLVFLGGVFDVLDGEVARSTGRASARGDVLDHVLDRYGDFAIVLGVAVSGFADPTLALLALATLLLVSYMGTQAQAVGVGRLYGGALGRAERLILLSLGALAEFDLSLPWPWAPSAPLERIHVLGLTFTVLDLVLLYFVVAGQLTAVWRARTLYKALPQGG